MLDRSKYWEKWPYDTKEEGQAEDILRTCAKERGYRNMPIPVPIEELIEGPLHMNFEVCDLSGLGPDVIGSAWCERPPTIAVSEKIENENGRFRFTCAHELGHIVLHRHLALRFDDAEQGMLVQDNGMEAEANRFASRILMPWQAVESEMMRVFRDFDITPGTTCLCCSARASDPSGCGSTGFCRGSPSVLRCRSRRRSIASIRSAFLSAADSCPGRLSPGF